VPSEFRRSKETPTDDARGESMNWEHELGTVSNGTSVSYLLSAAFLSVAMHFAAPRAPSVSSKSPTLNRHGPSGVPTHATSPPMGRPLAPIARHDWPRSTYVPKVSTQLQPLCRPSGPSLGSAASCCPPLRLLNSHTSTLKQCPFSLVFSDDIRAGTPSLAQHGPVLSWFVGSPQRQATQNKNQTKTQQEIASYIATPPSTPRFSSFRDLPTMDQVSPSTSSSTNRGGRPKDWTPPRVRKFLRLYLYTTFPTEQILRLIEEKAWNPGCVIASIFSLSLAVPPPTSNCTYTHEYSYTVTRTYTFVLGPLSPLHHSPLPSHGLNEDTQLSCR
jgi:hypothetical protein